uniref:Uncharacterized protein n=1 Tax=Rhizophora mucronata TaxID=61149 RepID=A0A2P2M9B5_RHIMU
MLYDLCHFCNRYAKCARSMFWNRRHICCFMFVTGKMLL